MTHVCLLSQASGARPCSDSTFCGLQVCDSPRVPARRPWQKLFTGTCRDVIVPYLCHARAFGPSPRPHCPAFKVLCDGFNECLRGSLRMMVTIDDARSRHLLQLGFVLIIVLKKVTVERKTPMNPWERWEPLGYWLGGPLGGP